MPYGTFAELKVYNLSEDLSDLIWEMVVQWDAFSKDTIGKQLVRSADSIGANIAEGHGKYSYADNKRYVRIARGSLNETKHFLRRALKRKLINKQHESELKLLIDNLSPKLNAYLNSIGKIRPINSPD